MDKRKFKIGDKVVTLYGELECLGYQDSLNKCNTKSIWECYCGIVFEAMNSNIGLDTKSCGCLREKTIQDSLKNPSEIYLYALWCSIKTRCYNKNIKQFSDYGGRGIAVHSDWVNDSKKFIQDIIEKLGHRPTDKHQLDRIDNDGNYEINNVRWVTVKENGRNKRHNAFVTICGKSKTISEWSEISKISNNTLSRRIKANWSERDLLISVKENKNIKTSKIQNVIYRLWRSIKNRCYNKNNLDYKNYGGRGVVVHLEWKDNFKKFEQNLISEIGPKPTTQHQLDRINNDGNYEPGNLRWATPKENCRNRNSNVLITINNEIKTISEWSEISGLNRQTLSARIKDNWPESQLLSSIIKRKLNKEDAVSIRNKFFNEKVTQQKLCEEYHVSKDVIKDVIHKRGAYAK